VGAGEARGILYLDWNATTPPLATVLEKMAEVSAAFWGNPASVHQAGRQARAIIESAREYLGAELAVHPRDIVFTSGGTEANNLALHDSAALVTSRLEHPSVTRIAEALEAAGRPVVWLHVPTSGRLDPGDVEQALAGLPPGTKVAVMAVNHEAGLVKTELQPATRGQQKICARVHDIIMLEMARGRNAAEQITEVSMPIGAYVDCQVTPTCGLATETGIIGFFDDPASFYEPERLRAQLLWFHNGYVEYRFPNRVLTQVSIESLQLSLELCSEAPLHHKDWASDVTLWVNGVEIGTWTSPGDFGGQRGVLTPEWWETWNSQYGLLKVWQVTNEGSFVDGVQVSSVRLKDLSVSDQPTISVRIGVKPEAQHVGGLNIFGRRFGNYPQDIVLLLRYQSS
jgi:predicted transcriptional regulator